MKPEEIAASLHPLEIKVYEAFPEQDRFLDREISELAKISQAQVRTVIEWQRAKDCMRIASSTEENWVELTELGRKWRGGAPEELLVAAVQRRGEMDVKELTAIEGLTQSEAGQALGALKKKGILVSQRPGAVSLAEDADLETVYAFGKLIRRVAESGRVAFESLTDSEAEMVQGGSRKRGKSKGVFRIVADVTRELELTSLGKEVRRAARSMGRDGDEINLLTPRMLADDSFAGKKFRRYNLAIRPPRRVAGRRHPYREFLDHVRRKLVGLGFEEMRGELVENEFWLMDALFMPQFHAARDIHDVYLVKNPEQGPEIEQPYAERVAEAHTGGGQTGSRGWGYAFDHLSSRRLLLRSQGTVLSARWLKKAKIPGKYFAIARCFRPDEVDATHAADFFQCEGIVLGSQIDFVTLLGLLKLFAVEVAKATEVKFAPAYFPFTEPSVEVHIKHPELGWMELGGAGIFRPEVTWPQGVDVPVIAWGLGLDRMAMMALGIDDIRDLFSPDLGKIRSMQVRMRD
jgi:phenylalanyl-tRNA synthetase alpha chain